MALIWATVRLGGFLLFEIEQKCVSQSQKFYIRGWAPWLISLSWTRLSSLVLFRDSCVRRWRATFFMTREYPSQFFSYPWNHVQLILFCSREYQKNVLCRVWYSLASSLSWVFPLRLFLSWKVLSLTCHLLSWLVLTFISFMESVVTHLSPAVLIGLNVSRLGLSPVFRGI